MSRNIPSNSDAIIDYRDITDRVEELEDLVEADTADDEDRAELKTLQEILNDTRGVSGDHKWRGDWYPGSAIRDSYFEKAMDEMLEDIGDLPKNLPGYLTITVDYDALKMDYTTFEFDGVTYWVRW